MSKERFASFDIGSNTILMLIVEKDSNKLKVLRDEQAIARLGENVWETNSISDEAIHRAEAILKKFKSICDKVQVKKIFAIASSAIREARNGKAVAGALSNILDTEINIISGNKEAELSYLGTVENEEPSLVIDIGGGSTEIIIGHKGKIHFKQSIPIGVVKLTEKYFSNHPPKETEIQAMRAFICDILQGVPKVDEKFSIYAVAGTPTTLAAVHIGIKDYNSELVNHHKLELSSIQKITNRFLKLTVPEITQNYGIEPMRADVISAGSIILEECLSYLQRDYCIVNVYGLRLGVLKEQLID
ncbi:MAG: hypothetical protein GX121_01570 [Ignavibacteria bacterium]|nr:hypothetical protein [Ignavibacteria bacterium]